MDLSKVEKYIQNPYTIRISGRTIPNKAGACALHFLNSGNLPEFLCIGANASQQATKSMGVFLYLVELNNKGKITVVFQPRLYHVELVDRVTNKPLSYLATVWKTIILKNEKQ